jgi:hypothetical protein
MAEPWPYNPLTVLIRQYSTQIVIEEIENYALRYGFRVSAFDLALQVMIVACSYNPEEIWHCKSQDILIVSELIAKGEAREATEVMERAVGHGQIELNRKLIKEIAGQQIERLYRLQTPPFRQSSMLAHTDPDARLTLSRPAHPQAYRSSGYAIATEKLSGRKVILRSVNLALSKAYAENLHYLHAARDDDEMAFGAFLENEEMPFAWVSYAPVGRKYKQSLLRAAGIDPTASLELTRAWNHENSPKNTMSILYAYAHIILQEIWTKQSNTRIQAVLTAVNPNLGFKGSAFRAVGFGLAGEKPTFYYYVVDNLGRRSFILRRNLEVLLQHEPMQTKYVTSSFPLLPTKELVVILNGSKRSRPASGIYIVDEVEYRKEMPER